MTIQDIRKEQEQVLAHAAERPSELFGLLDYIFEHTNADADEAEAEILDEIKRWVRDLGKAIAGKKVQLKKLKEQLLSAPTLTPVEAYYAMNSGAPGKVNESRAVISQTRPQKLQSGHWITLSEPGGMITRNC